jgi:hypothetical protein
MSSERGAGAAIVRKFHARTMQATDSILERALRIVPGGEKNGGALPALLQRHGNQNFTFFGGTPFPEIREIFRAVDPQPHELFCDAGAGYGHVVFYGACVSACRFRAVEIMPVRCAAMRRTAQHLGMTNVDIVEGDALTQHYEDVSYLLLNSPFFPDIADQFIARLRASRNRRLTVIAMNNIVGAFREDSAFAEIELAVDIPNYRFGAFRLGRSRSVHRP